VGQFWTPMVGQFSTPIDIYLRAFNKGIDNISGIIVRIVIHYQ
jgi:hypothetical protein